MTTKTGSTIVQRLLDAASNLQGRIGPLEETNSFITGVTLDPVTVGAEWATISGMEVGPQNYQVTDPDLTMAEDGASFAVHRNGSYFMALGCNLSNPTGDGYFEPAVQPIGVCNPLWPTDTYAGHDGAYLPAAIFDWTGITPGRATHTYCPCLAGDAITGFAKFSSADGLATIDVTAILFAFRRGM